MLLFIVTITVLFISCSCTRWSTLHRTCQFSIWWCLHCLLPFSISYKRYHSVFLLCRCLSCCFATLQISSALYFM